MAGTAFPDNLPSRLLGSLPRVRAVAAGTDLETLDAGGTPVRAAVVAGAESPAGPQDGCGYRVGAEAVTVPVEGDAEFFWWATVSYLASADTTLTLGLGEREERVEVLAGLHTLFLRGEGGWGRSACRGPTRPSCASTPCGSATWSRRGCRGDESRLPRHDTYPGLDGLRFLGALAVLVTHVAFQTGAYAGTLAGTALSRLDVGVAISSCCRASCCPDPGSSRPSTPRRGRAPGATGGTGRCASCPPTW